MSTYFWNSGGTPPTTPPPVGPPFGGGPGNWRLQGGGAGPAFRPFGGVPGGAWRPAPTDAQLAAAQAAYNAHFGGGATAPPAASGGATMNVNGTPTPEPGIPLMVTPHGAGWSMTGTDNSHLHNVSGSGNSGGYPPPGNPPPRNWFGPPGTGGDPYGPPVRPPSGNPMLNAFWQYIMNRWPGPGGNPWAGGGPGVPPVG